MYRIGTIDVYLPPMLVRGRVLRSSDGGLIACQMKGFVLVRWRVLCSLDGGFCARQMEGLCSLNGGFCAHQMEGFVLISWMCGHTHIHTHTCTHTHKHRHTHTHTCTHTHTPTHTHTHMHTHTHTLWGTVYVLLYICSPVCLYVYVCMSALCIFRDNSLEGRTDSIN